jgi:nitrile hydratase accessory protein
VTAALAVDGPAAPPRDNGELVFAEPWEGRAFGMAVTLHESGLFGWDRFQAALISRIKAWEDDHPPGECYRYYRCWLEALEDVLAGSGVVAADETTTRAHALTHRPAGHDHDHEHPHEH